MSTDGTQIYCPQKHLLNIFYFVSTIKIDCFSTGHTCPPSCNLERLRYNGKHSAKPFVRAAAEWAGAEHLPNPIKIGKRNRYESTHKSGQNAGCQVQLHQPDPAHCNRPGGRFGAGFDLPRCCMDRRIRQPVCRCAERRCPGAGVCYCCQCTGAGLLQAGPPLWYGGLAVHSPPPLWRLRSAL